MQGPDQQAYDRGTTIFSPDGRLYQVEYARKAVKQGAPVVGVRGASSSVLAAHVSPRSSLVDAESLEKLSPVDDHVGIASAGHAADARRLVDLVRRAAQGERLRFDEPATIEMLSTVVADHIQEYTQAGGARPYGTALLIGGFDDAPRLFETDPSGATSAWRAAAVGRGSSDILSYFEAEYEHGLAEDGALALAVAGLLEPTDELGPAEVDAVAIDADGYRVVPEPQVADAIEAAS